MTPGFAKTRAELPWLYYPESDRVIINAHNFSSAGGGPVIYGDETLILRGGSGNANLGTSGGTVTFRGGLTADGNGFVFDDINNDINCGATFGRFGTADWWIAAWVKSSDANGTVFANRKLVGGNLGWVMYLSGGKARILIQRPGGTLAFATSTTDVDDDVYHLWYAYRSGSTLGIMVDGTDLQTTTLSGTWDLDPDAASLCLVGNQDGAAGSGSFAGLADDVRIAPGSNLTPTQVADWYAAGRI